MCEGAELLQVRNAGLDFVAETLPVIGKNQVIKRSILRTARQHGATVALADATAEDIFTVRRKALCLIATWG